MSSTRFDNWEHVLLKCNFVIFAAVILHESCGNKNMEVRSLILPSFLENSSCRLYTLGSSTELHVLDITQGWINVLNGEEILINFVDLLEVHICFFKVSKCEVQKRTLIQYSRNLQKTFIKNADKCDLRLFASTKNSMKMAIIKCFLFNGG